MNSTANRDIFKCARQSGKNSSATNAIKCGRVIRIFSNPITLQNRVSLLPNNKPIWQHNVQAYFLYRACSEDILLQRSPGYLSESEYHRMRVWTCLVSSRPSFRSRVALYSRPFAHPQTPNRSLRYENNMKSLWRRQRVDRRI